MACFARGQFLARAPRVTHDHERSTPETINELLSGELSLTMKFLQAHPKVYWIWNHRQWCLQNVPPGPGSDVDGWKKKYWAFELQAVEKMLNADARNCEPTCSGLISVLTCSSPRMELQALRAS